MQHFCPELRPETGEFVVRLGPREWILGRWIPIKLLMTKIESQLWQEWHRSRSVAARNLLVTFYLPQIIGIGRRLRRGEMRREVDVYDIAHDMVPALIRLIDRFDNRRGDGFWMFARARLAGEALDQMRRRDWIPHDQRRRARENPNHRLPRMLPIAGIDIEQPGIPAAIDHATFWTAACEGLRPREASILLAYWRDGVKRREIARSFGITAGRVSHILAAVNRIMRDRQNLSDLLNA